MNVFSIFESFFFLCLAISFVLILLMVYHFKKRIDYIEKNNETLGDISKTIIEEFANIKQNIETISYTVSKMQNKTDIQSSFIPKDQASNNITDMFQQIFKNSELSPEDDEIMKNVFISGGDISKMMNFQSGDSRDSTPVAFNVSDYDNEELDGVESCASSTIEQYEPDFETQSNDDLEEVNIEGSNSSIPIHVMKLSQKDESDINDRALTPEVSESSLENIRRDFDYILDETIIHDEDTYSGTNNHDKNNIIESDNTDIVTVTNNENNFTRGDLQKMNVQMLRAMAIQEGLSTEPSKMKKNELITLILSRYD